MVERILNVVRSVGRYMVIEGYKVCGIYTRKVTSYKEGNDPSRI
jgi:hypothetical protein